MSHVTTQQVDSDIGTNMPDYAYRHNFTRSSCSRGLLQLWSLLQAVVLCNRYCARSTCSSICYTWRVSALRCHHTQQDQNGLLMMRVSVLVHCEAISADWSTSPRLAAEQGFHLTRAPEPLLSNSASQCQPLAPKHTHHRPIKMLQRTARSKIVFRPTC